MRRLLHFAEDSDTSGFFPQLARWHDRNRYQMFFGTLKPMAPWLRDFMETQGVSCFSCDCTSRITYPRGMLRMARFLRRERIEVLHTHLYDPSIVGLASGVLAGTPIRVLTRHHSDYHTRINKAWHVRLDQLCTRMSHAVIAVSQHTAEHLIESEGAPAAKVHTVLNGIDLERVRLSAPDAPQRLRTEFASDGAALLLIMARLHPEKGHEYLFRALAAMRTRVTRPVRLLVAGTGTYDEAYRKMVRDLGCEDMVRCLGFRKDSPDLMAAVDVLVLPSLAEAFGLVLTEALYLGTPVVATRVGGIPEIVDDGVDGILVPPADSARLEDALVELINDPEKHRRLAGAGHDRIAERFRFETMVRSYEDVYEELANGRKGKETRHARSVGCHPCV